MKLLLSGLDTVECAYYLRPGSACKLDFASLREKREMQRDAKNRDGKSYRLQEAAKRLTSDSAV